MELYQFSPSPPETLSLQGPFQHAETFKIETIFWKQNAWGYYRDRGSAGGVTSIPSCQGEEIKVCKMSTLMR